MSPVLSANHVLASLTKSDLDLIQPHLEKVELNFRDDLEIPNQRIEYCYFPDDCIVSVIADAGSGCAIEVGIIGSDSCTAQAIILSLIHI